ncbi:MAG: Crp/Fnr family transcriptional regulator [Clostridium sp.]|uniref:Crp/Fnr family transcriptional regulator n=1 Tax=Clostridium sp. TaxID=1506 RepID=UPI00302C9815
MLFNDTRLKLINDLRPFIEKEIDIKKKTMIFDQDVHRNNILILLEGRFKLTHLLPNSKEFILGYFQAPCILLPSFFDSNNFISLFRAETIEDSKMGIIPRIKISDFTTTLEYDILKFNDLQCQKVYLQMRDLLYNGKREALFSILIRLSNTYGIHTEKGIKLDVTLSNIDLAEYIGTAPETVSRLLLSLKNDNLILLEDKHIIITNIQEMKNTLNCSMCREDLCEI